MMLGYLLSEEAKEKEAEAENEFMSKIFVASPTWYDELWGENAIRRDEEKIEWQVPESRTDLRNLADELGLKLPDD